jgi:hypothetical protein
MYTQMGRFAISEMECGGQDQTMIPWRTALMLDTVAGAIAVV